MNRKPDGFIAAEHRERGVVVFDIDQTIHRIADGVD